MCACVEGMDKLKERIQDLEHTTENLIDVVRQLKSDLEDHVWEYDHQKR